MNEQTSRHMTRRAALAKGLVGAACVWSVLPARAVITPAGKDGAWLAPMVKLEGIYVPALFLSGSGGKSPEAAGKARAAVGRLAAGWPALRHELAALWPRDTAWQQVLAAVQLRVDEAVRLSGQSAWAQAHEALEHVREQLAPARRVRGLEFLPDRYTAFHAEMEHLTAASAQAHLDRAALLRRFTQARVLWRGVEAATPVDAGLYAMSPARQTQQTQAVADETAALAQLSEALAGSHDELLRKRLVAIKPPFIRAYTAFGRELQETP